MPFPVAYVPTDPRKLGLWYIQFLYISQLTEKHLYGEFWGTYQHSLRLIEVETAVLLIGTVMITVETLALGVSPVH